MALAPLEAIALAPRHAKTIGNSRRTGGGKAPRAALGQGPRVVGIGTSAGGLEAMEQFFRHVPPRSGLAFVVVQHLDPTHKGMLPELLRRFTDMRVQEVNGREPLRSDCVYVIAPNQGLSIVGDSVVPVMPSAPHGLRLPVDHFFDELAAAKGERSVGVILSGMGSDGTRGVRAIKDKGGLVLVQDPLESGFDGMPRSAIATGLADVIAPARELAARIIGALSQTGPHGVIATAKVGDSSQDDVDRVLSALRARTGHDFLQYKKSSVLRRLERRLGVHHLDSVAAYASYIADNPRELDLLFKELLIGVTGFLRDPAAWELLGSQLLPALLAQHAGAERLRAWVSACSTGAEAYSLAMIFCEALDGLQSAVRPKLQIFATDIDPDAIDKARAGSYPAAIRAEVSSERLQRFFREDGGGYRIRPEIREMVTFAPQDVLLDPPFTKLDLVCCRNLLIYLGAALQKKLLALFHYSLKPGGLLFLGSAETIGSHNELFEPLHPKLRLFRRRAVRDGRAAAFDPPAGRIPITVNRSEVVKSSNGTINLAALTDQMLLQRFSPAAVLVNERGDILYINGRTGNYLEPASGQANWNVYAMAREGLRALLGGALRRAAQQRQAVVHRGVSIGTNGGTRLVDVSVEALQAPAALRGMLLIVFTDVSSPPQPTRGRRGALTKSKQDPYLAAQRAQEESRRLFDDAQTAQEELKSANEELQSTNEELQSTNEELTTSKEEMQSMNEELQTVNAELQSKLDELSRTSSDMKNLLDSTDIATIFLDASLHVRRFTPHATEIFKLIPGDVNRPLSDIVSQLAYPELEKDVGDVLRKLVFCEKEIAASQGRWFKVRIMPYRTADDRIDGVVITFTNISEHKLREAQWQRDRAAGKESV